jgi:hypothetical protein
MKNTLSVLLLSVFALPALANTTENFFGCGNGNTYRYVTCEVQASATYEAGYTEVYGTAYLHIDSARSFITPATFQMGPAAGNLAASAQISLQDELKITFNQDLKSVGRSVTVPVTFPQGCKAEAPGLQLATSYVATIPAGNGRASYSELDLFVSCKNVTEFEED